MNWLWTSLLWWVIGEIWISIIIVWGRGYINCVLMQWIRPPYSDLYIRFTTTLSYQLFLFLSDAFYWYSWTHMCGGCWLYQSFSVYNKSDIEAESDFQQLIQKCIDLGWTVQIMWWILIRKKGGNSSWKYPSTLLFDCIIIVCIFHSDISISFTSVVFLSSSWTNSNSRDEIKLAF